MRARLKVLTGLLERAADVVERYAVLLVIVGVVLTGALGLKVLAESRRTHRLAVQTHQLALSNQTLGLANQQLTMRLANDEQVLQKSRKEATLLTCEEGNERHLAIRVGLKVLVRESAKLQTGQRPTLTLAQQHLGQHLFNVFVSALQPRFDCRARVKRLTGTHPGRARKHR